MRLTELLAGLDVELLSSGDAEITSVVVDSREAREGALFVARKGWYVDGHEFLERAVAAGASAVVISTKACAWEALGVPVVFCADEDPLLGELAARFYGHPTRSLRVFGVTGTNGKTSVAWMLDELLRACGERTALISTVAYRVGDAWRPAPNTTPDALVVQRIAREALDAGATSLVMEVSSHGTAIGRVAQTAFDAMGFTNLTRDHLDFHGDDEGYARAKAIAFSLYGQLSAHEGGKRTQAIFVDPSADFLNLALGEVQLDDRLRHLAPLARRVSSHDGLEPWTIRSVGSSAPSAGKVVQLLLAASKGAEGSHICFEVDGQRVEGDIRAPGAFQVTNALLAITMVRSVLGDDVASWRRLLDVMGSFLGIPGRMELVADPEGDEPAVFVDYAHTPDALRAILDSARALGRGPLTAVAGCGGDRDRGKRPLMAQALLAADHRVLTSDNPRSEAPEAILREMAAGIPQGSADAVIVDRREAIEFALSRYGGTVVIAGKGHETYEEIAGRRYHWDDRDEARAALAKRRYGLESATRLGGWSLRHLAFVTGGEVRSDRMPLFRGLSTDTRTLKPGDIFVALRGANHDGHDHVARALAAGASLALVERAGEWAGPTLQVASTHAALQAIARGLLGEARRARGGLETTAITGSNGKTTTRALTRAWVIARDGRAPLATQGNFNNQIGLPLSVAPLALADRCAVLEMGANRYGDIQELVEISRPTVAVLTSIGASHLEGFGSIDGVREAKAEMVRGGRPQVVVLPHAELAHVWGRAIEEVGAQVLTFGAPGSEATLWASRADALAPILLEGQGPWAGFHAEIPLSIPGKHNAGNLAAALLASRWHQGALMAPPSTEEIARFVDALEAPPGRMERYEIGEHVVIFDAYNANPTSTLAALDVLREGRGQRVAVLGELFELGAEELALHAEVLAAAAACADQVVAIGPRWGEGDHGNIRRFLDRDAAAEFIGACTALPSTVLWKGSRGARLEELRTIVETRWRQVVG